MHYHDIQDSVVTGLTLHYMIALKVISHNPCGAVTARNLRYKIKPRTRRVETYNLTKFMDAWLLLMQQGKINAVQGDFVLWLLMTGCRLDEAGTIKWSDIDNEQLTITILDTKNGNPHILPLTRRHLHLCLYRIYTRVYLRY